MDLAEVYRALANRYFPQAKIMADRFDRALVIGVTALIMSPQMAIGGALETTATLVFGRCFWSRSQKHSPPFAGGASPNIAVWMIRGYAIGLAVATVRPIVGLFFATNRLTRLTPHDFFGIAFWLGFTLSLATAETWIRYTARPQHGK